MSLIWRREPFNGGCAYYTEEAPLFISGSYPTDQVEDDCTCWRASNIPEKEFPSADAAMSASEAEYELVCWARNYTNMELVPDWQLA